MTTQNSVTEKQKRDYRLEITHRKRRVKFVLKACPPIQGLETSPNPNKLPIGQLIRAADQFIFGYFENTVLDSAFAVEYALLFKLDAELEQKDKEKIAEEYKGGFDLRTALNKVRGKWIDEELYNRLQLLNNFRDMSAHPSNWISLYNVLNKQFEDQKVAKKLISKSVNKTPSQIAHNLESAFDIKKAKETQQAMMSYADSRWANLPNLEWASKKDTLRFQIDFIKRHSKPMIEEMLNEKKIIDLIQNPSNAAEMILDRYRFPEEIALKSIRMAFDTLKHLDII
jgi:hypothetical protein